MSNPELKQATAAMKEAIRLIQRQRYDEAEQLLKEALPPKNSIGIWRVR